MGAAVSSRELDEREPAVPASRGIKKELHSLGGGLY